MNAVIFSETPVAGFRYKKQEANNNVVLSILLEGEDNTPRAINYLILYFVDSPFMAEYNHFLR